MSGRKKEPIELIVAKGKKHLTKEEIKNRIATEVKAPADDISPPEYFSEELKELFIDYATQLKALEIISNLDVGALERYVVAEYQYREITAKLLETKLGPKFFTLKDLQSKIFKEARAAATDLGLTIASRCKLVAPVKQEEKKVNKFERFAK